MKVRKRERGVALLVAIVALVCVLGLSLGLFYTSLADRQESIVNQALIRATAVAEGAVEKGQKELLEAASNYNPIPTDGTFTVNGHTADYTIEPVGDKITGKSVEGVKTVEQQYLITADAEINGMNKQVRKIVNLTCVPLFQFAIFYDKDLEVLPGPSLTINGPVHTNGDMYLGCESTLTLNTEYVRAVGEIYRRRKDDGAPTEGIIDIRVWGENKFEKMESKKNFKPDSVSGFDSDFDGYDANGDGDFDDKNDYPSWKLGALELWNGTVRSGQHSAKEIAAPEHETIERFVPTEGGTGGDYTYDSSSGTYVPVAAGTGDYEKGFYHERAGVVIEDGVIYKDGSPVTGWSDLDGDGSPDNPLSQSTFYDAREETDVTVTNVDLEKLAAQGCWPDNGLLYAVRTDSTVEQPNGIRLTNADVLAGALTVASENPIFTLGDYNIGDAKTPKQPAAIMTDAYNVLSESWDDTKTAGELPTAHPTNTNAAIMTGAHPTTEGQYNGGFENLPRFHERWNGSPAEIRGSFVYGWDSETAQGDWAYGDDRYTALSRDWDYDTALDDPDFLPPFTPKITYIKRVVWISR